MILFAALLVQFRRGSAFQAGEKLESFPPGIIERRFSFSSAFTAIDDRTFHARLVYRIQ
jgi:hypothetical protein